MLDGWAHRKIDPGLSAMATQLAAAGVRANAITYAGLVLGLAAAAASPREDTIEFANTGVSAPAA